MTQHLLPQVVPQGRVICFANSSCRHCFLCSGFSSDCSCGPIVPFSSYPFPIAPHPTKMLSDRRFSQKSRNDFFVHASSSHKWSCTTRMVKIFNYSRNVESHKFDPANSALRGGWPEAVGCHLRRARFHVGYVRAIARSNRTATTRTPPGLPVRRSAPKIVDSNTPSPTGARLNLSSRRSVESCRSICWLSNGLHRNLTMNFAQIR